jgi:hypothetical protein
LPLPPAFVELSATVPHVAPDVVHLEVQLRNGTILRIPPGFDLRAVASLITALPC